MNQEKNDIAAVGDVVQYDGSLYVVLEVSKEGHLLIEYNEAPEPPLVIKNREQVEELYIAEIRVKEALAEKDKAIMSLKADSCYIENARLKRELREKDEALKVLKEVKEKEAKKEEPNKDRTEVEQVPLKSILIDE
jgi:hypothetical protein